jgi:hypothetical protein
MAHYIIVLQEVVAVAEQAKGYWDESGLDMHIAVKNKGQIAVSTKHWGRVHYIVPDATLEPQWLWNNVLEPVSNAVGRKLVKSLKGDYVYIHKLNLEQTQSIFDKIKEKVGKYTIERHLEWSWDIKDAVLPN